MAICPSTSPESQSKCALPDDRHYHSAGHASKRVDGLRSCWATTPEEQQRWLEKESRDG